MSELGVIEKIKAQAICDAVKEKEGSTEPIPFDDVADRIKALPTPSGENKLAQIFNKTVTEITVEDLYGVTAIPDKVFYDCKELTKVTLPDSVKSIGLDAFYDCEKLSEVTLGNGIEEIGGAFNYCSVLTSINMPSSLKKIYRSAFNGCYKIDKVFIEDLASWCQVNFGDSKPQIYNISTPISQAGKFYIKNTSGEYEIPTSIEIPKEVQELKMAVFFGAQNLLSVTIGGNVKSIGHYAFYNCMYLEMLNIESGVEIIKDQVFQSCKSLVSVTIPDSITSMGSNVFDSCTNLTDIYINKPEGSISGSPWGATNATVHWNTPLPSEEE